MSKTNKELAVDITLAVINANPRVKYQKVSTGVEDIKSGIQTEAIINVLNTAYRALEQLD